MSQSQLPYDAGGADKTLWFQQVGKTELDAARQAFQFEHYMPATIPARGRPRLRGAAGARRQQPPRRHHRPGDRPLLTQAVVPVPVGAGRDGARQLAAGELGTISSATGTAAGWREPDYFAAPWRGQGERGGGNFMNQGMHLLDLMVWLFGSPARTASFIRPHRQPGTDIDEVCVGIVEFEQGVLATVESSLVANPGEPFRVEVRGDRGAAVLTDSQLVITPADPSRPPEVVASCVAAQALTNQYSALASAIRHAGPPTVGIAAANSALDLAWNLSHPEDVA